MNQHVMEIIAIIAAFLAHFLGIKIGGSAALRAAAPSLDAKARFPWRSVARAFLEFLLQVLKSPGALAPAKVRLNGRDRQDK